jgi:uncharacterized protein YdeI (YjbR/CyaY-like superfamily)
MNPAVPTFFTSAAEFRAWLEANAATAAELLVGFWKVDSGTPGMTWPESVDEALCFGWIDGLRKRIDDRAYQIRFTPRKPTSIWSAVNIRKFEQLSAEGRMTEAGFRAHACRSEDRSMVYAYEQPAAAELTASEIREFKMNKAAWAHFEACPAGYRKVILHWVTSAKRPETRLGRLHRLLEASSEGRRLR